jgi:DNA-binding NtrC family response regulator
MEQLQRYSWPGNVRQLENTVERAIILSGTRTALYPHDFNLPRTEQARRLIESTPPAIAVPETGMDLQQTVQKLERTLIEQALRRTGGNKSQAADILGMKRTTLTARLKVLEAAV